MQPLPEYHIIRICLKYIHIVSSGIWLGTGMSILLLLYLNTITIDRNALIALNLATTSIDNYLLIPSACISIASGAGICVVEGLGMFTCSWIITKNVCSIMALTLGTFIAPEMYHLSSIADAERNHALHSLEYNDSMISILILAVTPTAILYYLFFISIKRPCTSYKNCTHCKESRGKNSEVNRGEQA